MALQKSGSTSYVANLPSFSPNHCCFVRNESLSRWPGWGMQAGVGGGRKEPSWKASCQDAAGGSQQILGETSLFFLLLGYV